MSAPGRRPDLRLAGLACGTWGVTLLCLPGPATVAIAVAVAAAVLAVLLAAPRRRWSAGAVLVLLGAVAAAGCTGLRVHARDSGPVARLADDHAIVTATLVVTDDPRRIGRPAPGAQQTSAVPARLVSLDNGGRTITGRAAVLVLADAAGWSSLQPSQRVLTHGRLASARGGDLTAAVLSARGPPQRVGAPSLVQGAAGRLRSGLRTASAPLPAGPRGLLPGLVDGDTSGMDPALTDDFRTTGLTHLVAVSGTNFAIVAGAVLLLLRLGGAGRRVSAVLAALALAAFVVLVRPSPSVLRAAVMGGIALLALASGRPRAALPALAASITALLLYDPALARSAGFALSVLATAGLLLIAPTWRDALRRRLPIGVAEALAVPAAAQVACAPVIAALSAQVSLVSVPANLLAVPAVAPATILGVLAAVVSPVSSTAAGALARLAGIPTGWLVVVAQHGARVPEGTVPWPGGRAGGLLLCATCLLAGLLLRPPAVRRSAFAAAGAVLLTTSALHAVSTGWPPPGWLVVACDVGQGDGLVVNVGPGAAIVVDAGPDPAAMDQCLRALHVRTVPVVVLSHFHADHVGGLAGVLHNRRVGAVLADGFHEPALGWQHVRQLAAAQRVPIGAVTPGERLTVGSAEIQILGPVREIRGSRSDPNNNSIVMRATEHGRSVLFPGDADVEEEQSLLQRGVDVRADVLKESHHGSAYVDPAFVAATHAAVVLISVGAGNDYGQPAPRTLSMLRGDGMRVLRTDLSGDVSVGQVRGRLTTSAAHTHPAPRTYGHSGGAALGPLGHTGAPSDGRQPVRTVAAVGYEPEPTPAPFGSGLVRRASMVGCWRLYSSSSARSSCSPIGRSRPLHRPRGPPTRTPRCTISTVPR